MKKWEETGPHQRHPMDPVHWGIGLHLSAFHPLLYQRGCQPIMKFHTSSMTLNVEPHIIQTQMKMKYLKSKNARKMSQALPYRLVTPWTAPSPAHTTRRAIDDSCLRTSVCKKVGEFLPTSKSWKKRVVQFKIGRQ